MATQTIIWRTSHCLPCRTVGNSPVIICLPTEKVTPHLCTDETDQPYEYRHIQGILVKSKEVCECESKKVFYYTLTYDDVDTNGAAIEPSDIRGVLCKGCVTTYIEDIAGNEISVAVDSETGAITITTQHGCQYTFNAGGVCISEEPDNILELDDEGCLYVPDPTTPESEDWHILGNAGTVDGTNFAGTTDNVPYNVRVNNQRVRRSVPDTVGVIIIDGDVNNAATGSGSSIGGGGKYGVSADPNEILLGYFSRIGGGSGNSIVNDSLGIDDPDELPGASYIGGGLLNRIFTDAEDDPTYYGKNVIGGGFLNEMQGSYSVIGGGSNNKITRAPLEDVVFYAWNSILGGDANEINATLDLEQDSWYNSIGGGFFNVITNEEYGTIAGGTENFIGPDPFETDFVSTNSGDENTVGGGSFNYITHYAAAEGANELSSANTIGGGVGNSIVNQRDCAIAGGALSSIEPSTLNPSTLIMFNNFIGSSYLAQVWGSRSSCIVSGREHDVFDQNSSGILSGYINKITSTVPIKLDDPPLNAPSLANVIAGGIFNSIIDGVGSSIIGGGNVRIGAYSAAYQSLSTRADPLGFPFTVGPEIDVSAFSNIFFIGDVDLWIGNVGGTAKKVKFFEPNTDKDYSSANFSSFRAQTQAANIEYIWPAAAGVAGNSLKIQSVVGTTVTLEWS